MRWFYQEEEDMHFEDRAMQTAAFSSSLTPGFCRYNRIRNRGRHEILGPKIRSRSSNRHFFALRRPAGCLHSDNSYGGMKKKLLQKVKVSFDFSKEGKPKAASFGEYSVHTQRRNTTEALSVLLLLPLKT